MIYRDNAIPIKFFMEFEMMHLEGKDPRLQRYSRKRTKKLALPDIKTSHKVIIIKM